MSPREIPLSFASPGRDLAVTCVNAGYSLQRRLTDLGLAPGVPVIVLGGCHPGPLLVSVKGSRLGLGFGVAQKIMVKEMDNE